MASSRRSSKISSIASARLFRASSLVRPWPFAPVPRHTEIPNRLVTTDLSDQPIGIFGVTRYSLYGSSIGISPQRVSTALSLKVATVPPKMLE